MIIINNLCNDDICIHIYMHIYIGLDSAIILIDLISISIYIYNTVIMLRYIQAYTCIYIYYDNDDIIFIYKYGFVCTIHTKKTCIYIQNVFVSMYCLSVYVFI